MRKRLRNEIVDTREVPDARDESIVAWLGDRYVQWQDDGVTVLDMEGRTVRARAGWLMVRWPDGGFTVSSPASAERVYRDLADSGMNLSEALRSLAGGERLTRKHWDNPDTYVVQQGGYPDGIAINANTARETGIAEGTVCRFRPYMMVRIADGSFVPWTPTQLDLFAEDWEIVEPGPDEDIAAGRVTRHDDVDDMFVHLKREV